MTLLKTESFVPLTAAPVPPQRQEFRVNVIQAEAAPAASANFQSLPTPAQAKAGSNIGHDKKLYEPRVSVQRDGNRVTLLRIQCTCGQTMDIACLYDETAANA